MRKCQSAGLCTNDQGYLDALAQLCAGANPPDFCPAGPGGPGPGPGGPGGPGAGTITYKCQWYSQAYNGSNWRWVAQSECVYAGSGGCSVEAAGWARYGNACPTQKYAVVPRTCRCP